MELKGYLAQVLSAAFGGSGLGNPSNTEGGKWLDSQTHASQCRPSYQTERTGATRQAYERHIDALFPPRAVRLEPV